MRTTLAIDDDVLAIAKNLTERDHKTLGEMISLLVRQGSAKNEPPLVQRNGIPLLTVRGASTTVTMELVNQLRDEAP